MQTTQPAYFSQYRSLKLTRDDKGVLVAEFHSNGGPFTFTAQDHTEFLDAFYRIAQDRANKIVILTGAGGDFIPGIDFATFGNVADPGVWSQTHDEGCQILENIANIRVPVIAAVEGRAHVHSEYALLANVIVAAESATFHDVPHFAGGHCARGWNLYDVELSRWSRTGRGVSAEPTAADGAHRARMGSRCRSRPERKGAQPSAGTRRAVPKGAGGHAPQHTRALHSSVKGAHCARSWLRIVARRGVGR